LRLVPDPKAGAAALAAELVARAAAARPAVNERIETGDFIGTTLRNYLSKMDLFPRLATQKAGWESGLFARSGFAATALEAKGGQMHRLFVAIHPPEEVRDALIDAMDDSPELRWVGDDQLHLTLRFIGEVERPLADDIAHSLGRVRFDPFELAVAGVGVFEQRNGGALWAAVKPKEPVAALAAKVERACAAAGLEPERRAFHPHITLARWNRRSAGLAQAFLERNRALTAPPFTVDRFILYESRLSRHGAHYEEVASYPLS
jgi:2'-5' RNA ligase